MNKKNKKGFTLIEMLVVIAIIAILVAIIIPAVSSSTKRAAAATDAANLRSAKAVISIGLLDGTYDKGTPVGEIDYEDVGVPQFSKYDDSKEFEAYIDENANVFVAYGELTIEKMADYADNGKFDAADPVIPESSEPESSEPESSEPESSEPESSEPESSVPESSEQPAGYVCDGSHRDTDPQDNVCDGTNCDAVFTPAHDETVGCAKDCQTGTYNRGSNTCNNCGHPRSEHSNIDYSYPNNGQGKCNHTDTVHVDGTWS